MNLRVMEKEDLPLFAEWLSSLEVLGEYNPLRQISRQETEKMFENDKAYEMKEFIIEKKRRDQNRFYGPFLRPAPILWQATGNRLCSSSE